MNFRSRGTRCYTRFLFTCERTNGFGRIQRTSGPIHFEAHFPRRKWHLEELQLGRSRGQRGQFAPTDHHTSFANDQVITVRMQTNRLSSDYRTKKKCKCASKYLYILAYIVYISFGSTTNSAYTFVVMHARLSPV